MSHDDKSTTSCDGCRRGLPINRYGQHFELLPKTGVVACTKGREIPPTDKNERDIRQSDKQKEANRLAHQCGRGLGHNEAAKLAEAFCELWDELEKYSPRSAERAPEDRNQILQAATEFAQHALKKRADNWKSQSNHGRQDEALQCREAIALAISGLKSSAPSSALSIKALAERCRPAVAHDARLREREVSSEKYAHHYKPVLKAEAEKAGKLLDELDAIIAGAPSSASGGTDAKDAARYRWLRDASVPPHNFYLSVPDEFKDERYKPQQVDAAIDAAIGSRSEGAAK